MEVRPLVSAKTVGFFLKRQRTRMKRWPRERQPQDWRKQTFRHKCSTAFSKRYIQFIQVVLRKNGVLTLLASFGSLGDQRFHPIAPELRLSTRTDNRCSEEDPL